MNDVSQTYADSSSQIWSLLLKKETAGRSFLACSFYLLLVGYEIVIVVDTVRPSLTVTLDGDAVAVAICQFCV